jgi:ABC-type Fe3+ transport system permease subunit
VSDARYWFDLVTALLWLLLAATGVVLRIRRSIRLNQIVLIQPTHPRDVEYLASVKRSTYLRLCVKIVFLIGALLVVFDVPWLWPAWRIGVVGVLMLMLAETFNVDHVRDRLGRAAEGCAP